MAYDNHYMYEVWFGFGFMVCNDLDCGIVILPLRLYGLGTIILL